jgi:hypothetical protein
MAEPGPSDYEAAERLVREAHARAEEAARAAAGSSEVPPNGWASARAASDAFPDLGALLRLLDSTRGAIPPELARQLADALLQLLVALRAIIDYSIARLERPGAEERRVEDIPVQ